MIKWPQSYALKLTIGTETYLVVGWTEDGNPVVIERSTRGGLGSAGQAHVLDLDREQGVPLTYSVPSVTT